MCNVSFFIYSFDLIGKEKVRNIGRHQHLLQRRLQRQRRGVESLGRCSEARDSLVREFVVGGGGVYWCGEIGGGGASKMLCLDCHSYCENDNEQSFGIFIRDGSGDFANIPCTARNRFNQISGLKFKAHGRRYIADVFRGHSTTLIGGDDWAKFKRDFNVCQGKLVVFDMSGRMPQAYVCYVGSGLGADHGGPAQGMAGGDVVQDGGAGAFAVDGEEEVIIAGHGVEDAPNIIYTRGVVLNDGEGQMLGLVITIKDGYIGPHFVHRLTPTNITSKLMCVDITKKIPNKIAQLLNLDPEGVVGLCMGVGEVVQVGYHIDLMEGWSFDKDWGVFATQNHLQVGDAVVFNFKQINAQGISITCVVNGLRAAQA